MKYWFTNVIPALLIALCADVGASTIVRRLVPESPTLSVVVGSLLAGFSLYKMGDLARIPRKRDKSPGPSSKWITALTVVFVVVCLVGFIWIIYDIVIELAG